MFRHTCRLWAGNLPLRALTGAALGVGLSCCRTAAAETRQEAARPNILLIVCDQLSARATALYSPGFAATPNLDRLLEESQRFTRAYTVCPLCMPARAAMWSGRYPHETDVVSNLEPPRQAAHPTLGEVFSRAGYRTVHFGKQHDAGMLRGFERNELGPMREFRSELPVNYDSFYDVDTTGKMVEYLKNDPGGGRPFLAVADLHNPHNICQFIGENDRLPLPEPEKLPPLPANFRCGDFGSRPLPVRYICCTHPRQRQAAHWTPERYRFYLYAYAQYISMADRQIGEILQALKESGKEIHRRPRRGNGRFRAGHETRRAIRKRSEHSAGDPRPGPPGTERDGPGAAGFQSRPFPDAVRPRRNRTASRPARRAADGGQRTGPCGVGVGQ
nr:sulfatase-like hydrolase/transferase [Victivallis vadensis]